MDYEALKNELINDPQSRGYAQMSDADAAADLNTARIEATRPIASDELLAFAGANGRAEKIMRAAEQGKKPDGTDLSAGVQSVAIAADRMIRRDGTSLDMSRADHVGLVDALVNDGVLDAADKTALQSLAATHISRAQQLGFRQIGFRDVARARERMA